MSSCGSEDTLGWRCRILVRQKHEILTRESYRHCMELPQKRAICVCSLEAAQAMGADDAI